MKTFLTLKPCPFPKRNISNCQVIFSCFWGVGGGGQQLLNTCNTDKGTKSRPEPAGGTWLPGHCRHPTVDTHTAAAPRRPPLGFWFHKLHSIFHLYHWSSFLPSCLLDPLFPHTYPAEAVWPSSTWGHYCL